MCLLDTWAWEMMPDGSYRRPATRTDEAQKSSVMLGQPPFSEEQMEQLLEHGTQVCVLSVRFDTFSRQPVLFWLHFGC
jgi:hypothetical protein